MAKKASKRKTKAKPSKKRRKFGLTNAEKKKRAMVKAKNIKERLSLHAAASKLADFHGGRGPVKSGCGRPRGS